MSCSLMWKLVKSGKAVDCDFRLRDAIETEFGLPAILDVEAVSFLRGLRAAGVDGASQLIELIEKHGTIELYKEC